jgi:hypothetical protein
MMASLRCESQELVNDEHFEKEENVCFNGDSSILFKIILEEANIERKKYLEVDFVQK